MPTGIDAFVGETEIDTSAAAATVNVVEFEIEPTVALMFVVPMPALVADPGSPITATVAFEEFQFAVAVKSCELPSVYVPVAANCCVAPREIVGASGPIAIETNAAGATVSDAEALTEPELMPIVVVPEVNVVAKPADAVSLLMVATPGAEELQCPVCVRSCVLPSV